MGVNTNEVVTRIVANNKQFDGAMNASIQVMERFNKKGELIGSTVKVLTKHMKDAESKTEGFRVAMTRLSRDIKVAGTIFNTLSGSIKGAYEAASEGAKIMAAEQFFKNAGKSIADYRKATNGMVSDAELMKKANLADSMGINEATFKKLVMVAEAAALKTGQSFDYMFNSIIVGTARSSRLLLDNLGIIVSVGQANETYAKKINKTVEALSAEEKQLAFVEEVARKSQGTLDEYAKATDRTAESFAKFDANVQNLVDTLKIGLAKAFATVLPAINKVLSELLDLLGEADWDLAGEYAAVRFLQGFTSLLAKGESFLPAGLIGRVFGVDATVFGALSRQQGEYAESILAKGKARAAGRQQEARWGAENNLNEIKRLLGSDWNAAIQNYVDIGTAGIDEMTDKLIANFLRLNNKVDQMFGKWTKTPTVTESEKKKGGRSSTIDKADLHSAEAAWEKWLKGVEEKEFVDAGRNLAAPFLSGVAQFDAGSERFDAYMRDWLRRWRETNDEYLKALVERNAPIGTAITDVAEGKGLFAPIAQAVADMSGGVAGITQALLAGGTTGAVAGPLGSVIGALIPVVMSLVDGLKPVVTVIGAVVEGLRQLIENALGQLLEPLKLLANPIKDLLAAVGLLVGAALRPLVLIFTALIGAVAVVVEALAVVVTALSPFVEMMSYLFLLIWSGGTVLIGLFTGLGASTGALRSAFAYAIDKMLDAVIWFNNAIVRFMRSTLGMKGFGKFLDREDFRGRGEADPIDENTSAVNENTRALRDFVREFRNLPQGYKAFGAVYASQDPSMEWRGPRRVSGIGMRSVDGLQNARWRT